MKKIKFGKLLINIIIILFAIIGFISAITTIVVHIRIQEELKEYICDEECESIQDEIKSLGDASE